jgi:hypothetical protein
MKINALPSPGFLSNGVKLRVEAAKAIGSIQMTAARTAGGVTPSAGKLASFFTACASALSALYEAVAPTISSRVATSATLVTMTFSEAMDDSILPTPAAFASAGNTVTAIAWTSPTTLAITGTGFASGEAFGYTAPAVNYLRDRSGNAVATSSANLTAP